MLIHNLLMKKLFIIITLLLSIDILCQTINKQEEIDIVGFWQSDSNEVTSDYHDSYMFYANSKFEFIPSGYNGLNRIIKIIGTYKLADNEIKFQVQSVIELDGGSIERSSITTLSDTWSIDGGKLVTKKIKSKLQTASFEFCRDNKKSISIDKRNFYKINE